jgi:hypothetical protein
LSEALERTSTVPETVAPAAGAVSVTVGGWVSPVAVPRASFEGGPTLLAASTAVTR